MRRILFGLAVAALATAGACHRFAPAPGATPGETVYNLNCIRCHGKDAGGADGPSLLDRPLTLKSIESQVRFGSPNGMPEFRSRLSPDDIRLATDWVVELRRRRGINTPAG